jgi:osmotically-inducible protein OsmY
MNKIFKHHIDQMDQQITPITDPVPEFDQTGLATDFYDDFYDDHYKAVSKVLEFSPKILIIGHGPALNEVMSNLKTLDAKVKVISSVKTLPKSFGPSLRAIVVVESRGLKFIIKECKKLVKNWSLEDIPVFAVVPDIKGAWSERKLYQTGVQAVFEWPREKNELPVLISNMIDLNTVTIPKDDEDAALKLAVRTRLIADRRHFNPKSLALYVNKGVVMLDGVVRSFARLKLLKEKITKMPGVRRVLARSVRVKVHNMDDIKSMKNNDSSLYTQKLQDEAATRDINKFIEKSLKKSSQENIKVKVFYGLASLKGIVGRLTLSKKIETFAESVDGVLNVQNKIKIRSWASRVT